MSEIKLRHQKIKLTFAISLVLLGYAPVQAEPVNPIRLEQRLTLNRSEQLNEPFIFAAPPPPPNAAPPPPPNIGQPGRRGGAARGGPGGHRSEVEDIGCREDESFDSLSRWRITALVPVYLDSIVDSDSDSERVFGVTTVEHPTFWFYMSYLRPATGRFVLRDEEENLVYQTDVKLPETPGVVSVSLPSTAPPLEIGEVYDWYFEVYCQPGQPPSYVNGLIRRNSLNPTLTNQLEQATPQQRIALYAANGIWHEALTAAAELRRANPNAPEWAALMEAVGLAYLATEPIVECCQPGEL